jgi:endonuclease/exonuclease/phosphatase family metal-dependent hydrolase
MYNNRIRQGGLAIMWRNSIDYAITELPLTVKTDRIMAICIQSPGNTPVIIVNVYCATTNETTDKFQDIINNLQIVFDTYSDNNIVIMCGDFNAQLGQSAGPRSQHPQNYRGKYFQEFITYNSTCSLITQNICQGPVSTYWPDGDNRNPSQIDHFIVDMDYMSVISYCSVYDDDCSNTSDHVPILLCIDHNVTRYVFKQRLVYNWEKCDTMQYGQVVREQISNQLSDFTIHNSADIDMYLIKLQECLIVAMTQCVPTATKCPYKRPYWDNELGAAHKLQKSKRQVWISNGRPRGMDYDCYREYKLSKKTFGKLLHSKHTSFEQKRFENIENKFDMDSRAIWKYIKSNKGDRANIHA